MLLVRIVGYRLCESARAARNSKTDMVDAPTFKIFMAALTSRLFLRASATPLTNRQVQLLFSLSIQVLEVGSGQYSEPLYRFYRLMLQLLMKRVFWRNIRNLTTPDAFLPSKVNVSKQRSSCSCTDASRVCDDPHRCQILCLRATSKRERVLLPFTFLAWARWATDKCHRGIELRDA